MIFRKTFFFTVVLILYFFQQGCLSSEKKKIFRNTERYELNNPVIFNLPIELDEISGLAYYAPDTSVFAIVDEEGILYKIPIMNIKNTRKWLFGKQKDYEDIVLKDSSFYILVSNGDIVKLNFEADSIVTEKFEFSASSGKKKNEFETAYADSTGIIILCKNCKEDDGVISSFLLNETDRSFIIRQSIDISSLAEKLGKKIKDIKPSAAAINPATGELYVLSSVSKQLLVISNDNQVKEIYELNPKIYKQPEGLAFTPAGDMIISNEVFLEGHATLLILKNKLK